MKRETLSVLRDILVVSGDVAVLLAVLLIEHQQPRLSPLFVYTVSSSLLLKWLSKQNSRQIRVQLLYPYSMCYSSVDR